MKKQIFTFTARQLTPFIDWSYFYHAWNIRATERNSDIAQQLKNDALDMIEKHRYSKAIFALCDAHSEGEDIVIENERLPMLRQQHNRTDKPNLCLSDFISPKADKIGLFATSVTQIENLPDDPYQNLLAQTVADRLAEATASLLHKNVRTDTNLWGYCPNEQLSIEEINRESYQGIRPAIGYPSLPDQSLIFIIDKLIQLQEIGITLTDNGMMQPHASVCGMMLSHPATEYFAVGNITDEQLNDYAKRRKIPVERLKKFLTKNTD